METVRTEYLGNLRTEALHVQSGNELLTDAPVDNNGKGEYFSPTDLIATAFGSCMLTVIGIVAQRSSFSIDGTKLKITKVMATEPRRIGEIIVEFNFPPNNYSAKEKEIIKHTALTCPVAKSLHPDLKQTLIFNF
ncbi:MAG: OsmC family protein [Bacteroidota bacterium]